MTTARVSLRLVPSPEDDDALARCRRLHPSNPGGTATAQLLYINGDREGRIGFAPIARRWERLKLLVVEGGRAGLRLAERRRPGLVVVDDVLPDVDAADVVTFLRQRTLPADVPILVLAHSNEPHHHARFCRAGASAFHTKPLNISEVDRSVTTLVAFAGPR